MSHVMLDRVRQDGAVALGTFSSAFPSDAAIRALAGVGYDFVTIDCQHGLLDEAGAGALLRGMAGLPCALLVRVKGLDDAAIGRVLDAGADGVVVPMVDTPEQARAAVAACRYPPAGVRSFGPARGDLGIDVAALQERVSCFAMIETEAGLENVRAIAALPGLAGLFVGPVDLGIALGVPFAEVQTSETLWSALRTVREACDAAGVAAACFGAGPDHVTRLVAEGYRVVSMGSDASILINAARHELEAVRGGRAAEATMRYGA